MSRRKAELVELVLALRDTGEESAELIGLALGVSRVTVWRILASHERRGKPRRAITDTLAGCSEQLRARIEAFNPPQLKHVLTESRAETLKPA